MDMENLSGTSIIGGICAVILAVVGLFKEWRKYKTDDKVETQHKLEDLQAAVNLALEEGRITDAGRLQSELNDLWEKYRKANPPKPLTTVAKVCAVIGVCALCTGCFTTTPAQEYIVIGERILIVEPGQEMTVPPLVPPAKKWYLVDNVGLAGWLKIPTVAADTAGDGVWKTR